MAARQRGQVVWALSQDMMQLWPKMCLHDVLTAGSWKEECASCWVWNGERQMGQARSLVVEFELLIGVSASAISARRRSRARSMGDGQNWSVKLFYVRGLVSTTQISVERLRFGRAFLKEIPQQYSCPVLNT